MRRPRIALVVVFLLAAGCKRPAAPKVVDGPRDAGAVEVALKVSAQPASGTPEPGPDAGEAPMVAELYLADSGAPEVAGFSIATVPPDAAIFVNHFEVGRSPLVLQMPVAATWGISAQLPGYVTQELTVWPRATQPRSLLLKLEPMLVDAGAPVGGTMTVLVESFPTGAYVFIDGVETGVTPLNAVVSAESHEVVALYAAYLRATQYVDGGPGDARKLFFKLVPGF